VALDRGLKGLSILSRAARLLKHSYEPVQTSAPNSLVTFL